MLSTSPADLVLLDLKMPGMNGIDVLRAIKEADATVEAIMITAYASLETIRGAMAYGASGYLIKPFHEDEVEEAVSKALARRAGRTGGQQEVRTLLAQLLDADAVHPRRRHGVRACQHRPQSGPAPAWGDHGAFLSARGPQYPFARTCGARLSADAPGRP